MSNYLVTVYDRSKTGILKTKFTAHGVTCGFYKKTIDALSIRLIEFATILLLGPPLVAVVIFAVVLNATACSEAIVINCTTVIKA